MLTKKFMKHPRHSGTKNKLWLFILIRTIANSMILMGVAFLFILFWPFISLEMQYRWNQVFGKEETPSSGFRELLNKKNPTLPPLKEDPEDSNFGIVIEKLNINAPVLANVDSSNYKEYIAALKKGVAHASGTAFPGDETKENNNVFLFAHSSLNIWDAPRYNAVFVLLRELEKGDRITTFYQGRRYDYEVFDKKVVDPKDVKYLTDPSKKPILTLQTCDPPGVNIRRLIITAKLVGGEGVRAGN